MIGVFDSGFGGLTILKGFISSDGVNHGSCLQGYNYVYLGDNARAPYGNKSQEVIYSYTSQAVDFLFKQNCELIIIACNTSSAKALRKIQQQWLLKYYPKKRVLGVVVPIAEEAVRLSRFGRIGVIGTRATIESGVYEAELSKFRPGLEIYQQACPLLVPLVEESWFKKPETKTILKRYLRPLKEKKIDTLILACTHYSFLFRDIQRIMGKSCCVLDSPKIIAEKLADYLKRHPEIETRLGKDKKRLFYTTDNPERFKQFSNKFLGKAIKEVKKIEL